MHIINFFICLWLPYLASYGFFGPTQNLVPDYFANADVTWIAAELGAVLGFWLGLLRNFVGYNSRMNEMGYQKLLWSIVLIMLVSKIIFAVPHRWFTGLVSFFLGVLAISKSQAVGKFSISIMAIVSTVIISYFSFVLVMIAWFKSSPSIFYYYIILAKDFLRHSMAT